jgi:glycosyltransferase involved in cell wall biosynthesis
VKDFVHPLDGILHDLETCAPLALWQDHRMTLEADRHDSTRSAAELLAGRRVAVLHEWVDAYAGSEQVFEAIAGAVPHADLIALSNEPSVGLATSGRSIRTTFLDRPALRRRRSLTLPLMPLAWRRLGVGGYDVVISSHHAFAHTNRLADGGSHLCYVHSPARYLWSPEIDERGGAWYLGPAKAMLRRVDVAASQRVQAYAANSTAVSKRIELFWGRESCVIHPPVRVEYFSEPSPVAPTRDYVLGFGRWIPYKNLHLVIEAADLAGLPVKIAGRGPDKSRIVAAAEAASVPVELIESPSDEQLRELYRNAACLVFPTVEDFGIVPVEAQAAGTPVVAPAEGGALDTVVDGSTGILVPDCRAQTLSGAISAAAGLDAAAPALHAQQFNRAAFERRLAAWVSASI